MSFRKISFDVFTIFILMNFLNSCSVINPDSPVPSYIHIDSISLQTDYGNEGSNAKRITDAWVIYDNAFLGSFPLPADIPLIGEGVHSISISGGIIVNGISSTRAAYPKYAAYDTTLFLVPNEKLTLSPHVNYIENATFKLVSFDDASINLTTTNIDFAPLEITQPGDPNAFENNSGKTTLDANHPVFEVASSVAFQLPVSVPSYAELNYKGENDFVVGVIITTLSGIVKSELLSIRASGEWKKIYISLNDLGGIVTDGLDYKIYLRAEKNSSLTTADLYFDNLKVVY